VILQVAIEHGLAIPYYCYHPGLSIVASCRICLAEVWQPNPRNEGKLEPWPKLTPTCQTAAAEGMVVYTSSPKAVQNQKAVMEYLLINHPLDCPVCDQAGECLLQDYSYQYGRSTSRFEEDKIKQPKKDLGPNVLLYADRCIMCSRCVRFTREVTGTAELTIEGRGAREQIDVFPGKALDNELAGNVVDLCPVGALLDKDFLFAKRVWHLTSTPSIDGITASGDNIWIEHAEGRVHRIKPRENLSVNRWWITDEIRFGWKFVHSEERLTTARRRQFGKAIETDYPRALNELLAGLSGAAAEGTVALLVSPMLASEEAYLLASLMKEIGTSVAFAMGPVPTRGEDHVYPPGAQPAPEGPGYVVRAEKAPNRRGVTRVLEAMGAKAMPFDDFTRQLGAGAFRGVVLTGNYPQDWGTPALIEALDRARSGEKKMFVALIDTLRSSLMDRADVVIPGATWAEKSGCFENATGRTQAFERAIRPLDGARAEGQIALDGLAALRGERPTMYDGARVRYIMGQSVPGLTTMGEVERPVSLGAVRESDMAVVEL
ncbi:MAG: molybdopterin-dependent oxidoreductase, partial [Phycisphaerales bacterium]|nr:molybdopterin-dependent oxidoreductase [Phycisphaerales bacterium]